MTLPGCFLKACCRRVSQEEQKFQNFLNFQNVVQLNYRQGHAELVYAFYD